MSRTRRGLGGIRRRRSWCWVVAAAGAWAVVGSRPLLAQQPKPLAIQVEAVYLLNFGRFTVWPRRSGVEPSSFDVCVLGRDPFGPTLDSTVATEIIDGKSVLAKRIPTPQDVAGCRILFVSVSEDRQLKPILQSVEKSGVLTVSDIPDFAERGGMIQFVSDNSRVRFAINVAAAEQAGLTLKSELLRVALSVRSVRGQ